MSSVSKEIPVACRHTVFSKKQRVEYKSIWGKLEARRLGVAELENGYQHQFPGDSETLRLVNEWVSMERICCPFFTFTIIASNEAEPLLLQLTGNEEVKAFLQSDIQSKIELISE
ncbi:MAG: hypothetical protein K0R75_1380 [Paenibacillaceae bacterium]|jgi:hypothetical protein|nr:hypothetical protein [Paenibacillaceae bacterium]